ncbi:unnamed protein product [Lactuca saligna]|uniref:Uncharacterized protein n=1 Tax=Lactuca saligna TaxID=75948 RepID=A0AA36DW38_LACSI|nr:unnamed protein product [Lactuca saligna]
MLLLLSLIVVPWMLLPKPFSLKAHHNRAHQGDSYVALEGTDESLVEGDLVLSHFMLLEERFRNVNREGHEPQNLRGIVSEIPLFAISRLVRIWAYKNLSLWTCLKMKIRSNETNVKPLTKELIDYLHVSDQDLKGNLTEKICSIVEKLSPDKIWYIDQMLMVLSERLSDISPHMNHNRYGRFVKFILFSDAKKVANIFVLCCGVAFSISIIKAEQAILQCLDVAAKAPHWPIGVDALSARCSKDLELNFAKSYNQLLGALVLKNYERQDATLVSWNSMYIVD